MASGSKKAKRLLLINRGFQLRLSRAAVGVGVLSTTLTGTVILYPLYVFEILRIPRFLPLPILASMLVAAIINISAIFYLAIIATHRIAGPMFSLHRSMRKIAAGCYNTQIRFRKADELQFISRTLNEMTEAMCGHAKSDLDLVEHTMDILAHSRFESEGNKSALLQNLESLRDSISNRIKSG